MNPESIEDPEIGELKFFMRSWDNPNSLGDVKPLKTRPCTPADFYIEEGNDRSEYGFYRVKDKSLFSQIDVSILKCIYEEFTIKGNY